jgi:hypothetical protein
MTPQGINSVIRPQPSGSHHFPKAISWATNPLKHEPSGNISDSNDNRVTVVVVLIVMEEVVVAMVAMVGVGISTGEFVGTYMPSIVPP